MKTCKKCEKTYEDVESNFHKDKSRYDGFHCYCKPCRKAQMEEHYYFKNPKAKRTCIDCGIDISDLNTQRLRCDGCKHIKETKRKKALYEKQKDSLEFKARARVLSRNWRRNNQARYKKLMKEHNEKRKKNMAL